MDLADRIQRVISYFLSVLIFVAGVGAFFEGQWLNVFMAAVAFILSYIPALIERNLRLGLPVEFEFTFVLFLFGTIYLGEINAFYTYFWWWDSFLHLLSGILLGLVGFVLIYIFNTEERIRLHLSPFFVGLFTFVFAVAIGTFWEIYEYAIDVFLGMNMQTGPLVGDTMSDLIVDTIGAFFMGVVGYYYTKKVHVPIFDRIITRFLEKNPRMFRRWKKKSLQVSE